MKFVILLLFSPLVACSFTSLCPQQPNTVTVNCNNQNPFGNPFFPGTGTTIPGTRGRVLDIGYNKPPVGSKLEFQLQRSDSSEESSKLEFQLHRSGSSEESSESDESSEEIIQHNIPTLQVTPIRRPAEITPHNIAMYQVTPVRRPEIPSIYTTTTVDNRLDFMRRGLGGVFRSNLRNVERNHVPGHINTDTTKPAESVVVDETHGHGHSGQYNHNHHHHEHSDNGHSNHGHSHGHMHDHHGSGHIHVPTHITHPSIAISGAHITPETHVQIGDILPASTSDLFVNQGQVVGIPTSGSTNGQYNLLHDTHDRLILTRRGYRALDSTGTYDLYPQDSLHRVIDVLSFPTITQDGFHTEINCDPIPIISEVVPQTEILPQTELLPQTEILPQTEALAGTSGLTSTMNTETLPNAQGSTTFITTENVDSNANLPQTHGESTVTKVTTTTEERPMTMTTGGRIPESSSSTVTKVTTTKVEERPTVETIFHETPAQTGSTVTKVTTTTTEERPIATGETIVHERPVETGSTITKVTTTTVEKQPMTTDVIGETFVQGAPVVQTDSTSGSTITTVTTTKTEGRPIIDTGITIPETIINGESAQSGSTDTKVTTTTTTEDRPISSNLETMLLEIPDGISGKQ